MQSLYIKMIFIRSIIGPRRNLRHYYPHGLHFALQDRFILAASAGSPYINIYEATDSNWRGVRGPVKTAKVLTDEDYLRCRISREDGGPKGLDIADEMNLLVVTCENQPLAFYDLASILNFEESKNHSWAKSFNQTQIGQSALQMP